MLKSKVNLFPWDLSKQVYHLNKLDPILSKLNLDYDYTEPNQNEGDLRRLLTWLIQLYCMHIYNIWVNFHKTFTTPCKAAKKIQDLTTLNVRYNYTCT